LEAIEMDEIGGPLEDFDFKAFRSTTPLRRSDVATVQSEGVAARRGFPAQPVFGKSALSRLFG
jgi:hypothetical protein